MTAYELAEQAEGLAYEVPADWSSGEPKNLATDIADMLRQQADLIHNLQKSLGFKNSGYETINLTPQTKPLSNEEIGDCADKAKIPYDDNKGFYVRHSNGSWVNIGEYLENFAKAIEERHGIK